MPGFATQEDGTGQARQIGLLLGILLVSGFMVEALGDSGAPATVTVNPQTLLAAFVRGGGAAVYGDYLFGRASRSQVEPEERGARLSLETSTAAHRLFRQAVAGDAEAGEGMRALLETTSDLGLWYVRPALDYLTLSGLYASVRPGYVQREEQGRKAAPWDDNDLMI